MKKPTFIITETILSLFLAASVAVVGLVLYDLKTDSLHIDKFNPFGTSESAKKSSDKKPKTSAVESSVQQLSEASKQADKQESGNNETVKLRSEPKDLDSQPSELVDMLKRYGYKIENNVSGNHLIVVDVQKSNAKVYCYQKSDSGYWWNIVGDGKTITDNAFVGEDGSAFVVSQDSKKTPGGIWWLGEAFYIGDKPNTSYPAFQITEDTYWVTDTKSKYYNKKVEGTDDKDWSTARHMITSDKQYKYGIVINYNTDPVKTDAGSAIFINCGESPTDGSVSLPENVMKTIIEWLDKDSVATVFITV